MSEMRERQRWKPEEDTLLRAYVRQYGPREWNLVSRRMNVPFERDSKSCLERWKNYLKPGIKKGSLSEEEQQLVIRLQAKHGNKWKKIAAEVPGRTAKRLGKWWEVFKEKQQRELKENTKASLEPLEQGKYDLLLENFAEKLVKDRQSNNLLLATPMLPPWLSSSGPASRMQPTTPSVTLSLSPAAAPKASCPWLQSDRVADTGKSLPGATQINVVSDTLAFDNLLISEVSECSRELEEGHKAWMMHKKGTVWRLKRVELQIESEKAMKKKEKMEEVQSKIRKLEEGLKTMLERIEAEYREQLRNLRRDADAKEQKLAEQWAAKHTHLAKFLQQMGGLPTQ